MDKDYHPVKAAVTAVLALVFFVVLVWYGVDMITTEVPEIEHVFQNTSFYAVLIGIPLVITIGLSNFFSKGDKKRLISGIVSTGVLMLYLYMVLNSVVLGFEGDEYTYSITFPGIIILSLIGAAIRGSYYGFEYFLYQKESEIEEPEEDIQYY